MFKHLLLSTDESPLFEVAFKMEIQSAKSINAKVTAFHAMLKFCVFTDRMEMLEGTKEEFARDSRAHAQKYLAVVEQAPREAAVSCGTTYATCEHPCEAIIQAAEEKGCDLTILASHARIGMQGFLLGSETLKVFIQCRTPVLVRRQTVR